MRIPYVDLVAQNRPLRGRLIEAVGKVLDHGQFVLGPELGELESRLEKFLQVRHVVGLNSGTDALMLALRLRGIGKGDEVITVSHSFVATASAIQLSGATPVFVDIRPTDMLMNPELLSAALTPRTRAVMPVHLNGFPCDITAISRFCEAHGLTLIEDCAQAFGARHRGVPVGSRDLGCFSLHPLKILAACGDAGFVTLNDEAEARRLRQWRNLGLADRDHCAAASGNSRLDTLQAAILLVKLEYAEEWMAARRVHAQAYRSALAGKLTLPPEEGDDRPLYSAFVVRHRERERLVSFLRQRGIDVKIHYPLAIHQQEAFAHLAASGLPVTETVVREIFSLPVSPELSAPERTEVIAGLGEALATLTA